MFYSESIGQLGLVCQQADQARIFGGVPNNRPSKQQIQTLIDILNALGWNMGLRAPTKSLEPEAWWNMSPTSAATIFNKLSDRYQTNEGVRELFTLARDSCTTGVGLPCMHAKDNSAHRYQVDNRAPFRI